MSTFDTHYLKPSDIAERLSMHRSHVYNLIKDGTLPHIRIGKAVRVPAAAFEAFVRARHEEADDAKTTVTGAVSVVAEPVEAELESRLRAFEEVVGMDPFDFVEAWKRGAIDDTPENAERAIDALALRAVLQRAGVGVYAGA
jgi:excisionase family DNA binding protein